MRLKADIENDRSDGRFLYFPLVDDKGSCLWPGKYLTDKDIKIEYRKIGNEVAWQREYMLRIISDEGQLIQEEWLHYYDELPAKSKLRSVAIGIDLAISQKTTADYTAMVSAKVYGYGKDAKIYILPNPVNKRITFPEIIQETLLLHNTFGSGSTFYVESVAAQEYLVQNLQSEYSYINVVGVPVAGADKRSRLAATTHQIQAGNVLFPKQGIDVLRHQLLGFGSEKHDDLSDAFSLLINEITKDLNRPMPEVWIF
jgi:predicted phage terminase large subunit-like protein